MPRHAMPYHAGLAFDRKQPPLPWHHARLAAPALALAHPLPRETHPRQGGGLGHALKQLAGGCMPPLAGVPGAVE